MTITASKVLLLAAVILFVLAFFAVTISGHTLIAAGLACLAASFLIP